MKGTYVYVALIERDFEGEEFQGLFSTAEDARRSFEQQGQRPPRWKYDRSPRGWRAERRASMQTYVVRREVVR